MATPSPAASIISTSFQLSPTAIVSAAESPRVSSIDASAAPFDTPGGRISR